MNTISFKVKTQNMFMKSGCFISVMFLLLSCSNLIYSDYTLIKAHPGKITDLNLKIISDTSGLILSRVDHSLLQNFRFIRRGRNFLVITYIDDTNNLVYLQKGDTIVTYKKEIYMFNARHKLVFKENATR